MPDHIHLLLSIPPKYSVSSFMEKFINDIWYAFKLEIQVRK